MEFKELELQNFSFFGKGNKITGEFKLSGIIKLAAHMEGNLFMNSQGSLTIERDGVFNGNIHCHDIEVFGEVCGDIFSSGRVILQSSAKVRGRIETQNLTIYPGALVNIEGHTLN